jgi:hypothetical protein
MPAPVEQEVLDWRSKMKHSRWLGLAAAMLVVVTLACGGSGGERSAGEWMTLEVPYEEAGHDDHNSGVGLASDSGWVTLGSGFARDPYHVSMVGGGGVDVSQLGRGSECTGWIADASDFRLTWSGDSTRLRFFFVPAERGADASLIVSDPRGDWLCSDDYSGLNPLVEVEGLEAGPYEFWVGSASPDEPIGGILYITELDLDLDDFAGPGAEVHQWAIAALASSEQYPGESAQRATGAPDASECGMETRAWASETPNGIDWLELRYVVPVLPTAVSIYEAHQPGFIVGLEVIDTSGQYHLVWEGVRWRVEECMRILTVPIGEIDFEVVGVRLSLDQRDPGYREMIDAVELVGTALR